MDALGLNTASHSIKNPKSNDRIFDRTLIDENSLKIIEGSTVDFKKN